MESPIKIIDEDLLDTFRVPGTCEICGKWCRQREPHHIYGRGFGGGSRLDIRYNLLSLGHSQTFQCQCHHDIHAGKISREKLLRIVANREGCQPSDITDEINKILRTPKGY
jgi:hypothetical protein